MPKPSVSIAIGLVTAAAAAFLFWPSAIDPLAWEPGAARPLEGPMAPNDALAATERLAVGRVQGPEDVAVDDQGRIYVGTARGEIVRLPPSGAVDGLEVFADTGGRPLGLHFDAAGSLVVADAAVGLLSIAADGTVSTLTDRADGLPFRFTDDLDIASDGRIYFTDASSRFDHHHYLHDLLEARPHGRLLRYDPATENTETLLDGLYFANGVALSQDESFVLVNETYRYRITRYWLTGPEAGTSDVFIDRLPGYPDGVSSNRRGTFWVALFTVRNPQADRLAPRPFLKSHLAKLPKVLWPKPEPYGLVIALDEEGRVVRTLQDPGGRVVPQVTSAEEVDGWLYLGNLDRSFVGRLRL
ncbi:MAG: SMP-30/gluconolactonase/LRE family protein [Acidobacteriota bacterium]